MRARVLGTWAICVLAAYGCGGGGGSSTPPPSPDAHDAPRGDAAIDRGTDQRPDAAGGDASADRGTPRTPAHRTPLAMATPMRATAPASMPALIWRRRPARTESRTATRPTSTAAATAASAARAGSASSAPTARSASAAPTTSAASATCLRIVRAPRPSACTARAPRACAGCRSPPTGTVLAQQTVGDCQSRQCAVDGTVKMVADNSDIHDDRNPCTNDTCASGVPMNAMLPINSSCGGQNRCNAAGQCVGCLTGTDCPGSDTVCQTRTCTAGICGFSFKASGFGLPDPTARRLQGPAVRRHGQHRDHQQRHRPAGRRQPVHDRRMCARERPRTTRSRRGRPAAPAWSATAPTHCVACLTASTCPGTDTECHTRTCINGACGVSNTAAGTITVAQTVHDCKRVECNGNGGTFTVPDVTDLPVDGNACTNDVCNGDTPSNPAVMAGTNCGGTSVCDGAGVCVGCLTAATCPGSDTECHTRTCSAGHQCGILNATLGKLLAIQMVGDCHRNQCDGAGNPQTVIDNTDVHVDGNVCTDDVCTNGTPTNPSLAQGTSCGTEPHVQRKRPVRRLRHGRRLRSRHGLPEAHLHRGRPVHGQPGSERDGADRPDGR